MFVIKHKFIFLAFSAVLVAASLFLLFRYGLNLGIDFRGGAIVELAYGTGARREAATIRQLLAPLNLGSVNVQPAGDAKLILRLRAISEAEHRELLATLRADYPTLAETRFSSIGPSLGAELSRKGIIAIALAVVFIIIYIAIAFWAVSRPVRSWKYGLIAIIALLHDIAIPAGVFAYLGFRYGIEVDALFLTALLTIFGLSISDTIVVFDRIRENLKKHRNENFAEVVGQSLNETFVRSFNTSLTVILALLAVLFFGSETTRWFALALTIGMIVGTYSSIFVASPLLVLWSGVRSK